MDITSIYLPVFAFVIAAISYMSGHLDITFLAVCTAFLSLALEPLVCLSRVITDKIIDAQHALKEHKHNSIEVFPLSNGISLVLRYEAGIVAESYEVKQDDLNNFVDFIHGYYPTYEVVL